MCNLEFNLKKIKPIICNEIKKRIRVTVLLVFALLFIPATASFSAAGSTIEIKVGSHEPEGHFLVQSVYLPYTREIEKRTNGKVQFKWYHAGSLVKANQTYDALKGGLIDMTPTLAMMTMESQFPVSRVMTLPFMFDSTVQVDRVYKKAYETIPEFRDEYKEIKLIGFHGSDFFNLHMVKTAPETVEDMKGLTLWAPSKTVVELANIFEATPRSIKIEDIYMSLQRKAIDGAFFPTAPLAKWKLTDVCDNHTIVNSTLVLIPMVMSERTWNKLPDDVKAVFNDMTPSLTDFCGAIVDNRRNHLLSQLKKRGDTINVLPDAELSRWKEKASVMYDNWIKLMGSNGMDGEAILAKVQEIAKEYRGSAYEPAPWWGTNWKK